MSLVVAPECTRLGLQAGAIVFRGLQVDARPAALHAEIAHEVESIRARFADAPAIRTIPEVTYFCDLLRRVGVNPRREQPSVERLLSSILRRRDLPAINNLVDAYNLVSVRSLCSLGAHDLDTIALPVSLRILTGSEKFTPLGQSAEVVVKPGEYAYVDASDRVMCRLDLAQAEFSKVTAQTANVLLIIEATANHDARALKQACTDITSLVSRYCGGRTEPEC